MVRGCWAPRDNPAARPLRSRTAHRARLPPTSNRRTACHPVGHAISTAGPTHARARGSRHRVNAVTFEAKGLRVLITGASSGIGAELAERFAQGGATVGLAARREDRLTEVLARCRADAPKSAAYVCDVADPA